MRSFKASEIKPGDAFVISGRKWVVEKSELQTRSNSQRKVRVWTCIGPENERQVFERIYFTRRWDLEYEVWRKQEDAKEAAEKERRQAKAAFMEDLRRVAWKALRLPSSNYLYGDAPGADLVRYGTAFEIRLNRAAAEQVVNGDPDNLREAFREMMEELGDESTVA